MKMHRNIALGVIEGLQRILDEQQPARIVLPKLFKKHRQWGGRDRKTAGKMLFDILRWKRLYAHCAQSDIKHPNHYWDLVGAWGLLHQIDLPPWEEFMALSKKTVLMHFEKAEQDIALAQSFPQWMHALGVKAHGQKWELEMKALNQPATRAIRVNLLKISVEALQQELWNDHQIEVFLIEGYPEGLFFKNYEALNQLPQFKNGYFEIQDGNSQKVAPFCQVKPGQKVLDACAGAGGKSLHLASLMQNKGTLLAADLRQKALNQLEIRAQRNGHLHIETCLAEAIPKNWINNTDVLLLDAPCSGTGVIQRTPETKWLLTPEKLAALCEEQAKLLQNKAQYVKPNGALIYATCSILKEENQDQIETFLTSPSGKNFELEEQQLLLSQESGFDGFYMARLRKRL